MSAGVCKARVQSSKYAQITLQKNKTILLGRNTDPLGGSQCTGLVDPHSIFGGFVGGVGDALGISPMRTTSVPWVKRIRA